MYQYTVVPSAFPAVNQWIILLTAEEWANWKEGEEESAFYQRYIRWEHIKEYPKKNQPASWETLVISIRGKLSWVDEWQNHIQ